MEEKLSIDIDVIQRTGELPAAAVVAYLQDDEYKTDRHGWVVMSRPKLELIFGVQLTRRKFEKLRRQLQEAYPDRYQEKRSRDLNGFPIVARIKPEKA